MWSPFVFLASLLVTATVSGCVADEFDDFDDDLGIVDGKLDQPLACRTTSVGAGATKRFRVRGKSVRAGFTQTGDVLAKLSLKHYDIDVEGEVSTAPAVEVRVEDGELHNWTVRVHNLGDAALDGELCVWALEDGPAGDEGYEDRIPTLTDSVRYANPWCTYADTAPYVRSVTWEHPLVRDAMRGLGPGWRSTFTYRDWSVAYGLEFASSSLPEEEQRNRTARNFIKVVCGDHRDYPAMIERKLRLLAESHHYATNDEMTHVDTDENLFTQITLPAYERLTKVMRIVYNYKQSKLNPNAPYTNYNYGFGEVGHSSRRVDNGVAPWTHCEMKFMFERYMMAGAPDPVDPERYVSEYETYKGSDCTTDDFEWMYNFRGHRVFNPLWLESNAFVWNSRRARTVELYHGQRDYYLRPFASRYQRSRQAWGTYLLYPDDHHDEMVKASESGGGHIMYITDQDLDGDHLADYRLFSDMGCGDQGIAGNNPDTNCNMVPWYKALSASNTTGHAASWNPDWWSRPDMGFMDAFTDFDSRMARFNQALDRHTNWGPTNYYAIDAGREGRPRFIGAYSPIVAASYEISKSDWFARRDLPNTDEFERGRLKWMHVMRFRASNYYSEADLSDGRDMDFDRNYFNETSLSNDYYREHALDRFGWVPNSDMYANIYFVYADRDEEPPALEDIPAP